jgi:hypothetical protein
MFQLGKCISKRAVNAYSLARLTTRLAFARVDKGLIVSLFIALPRDSMAARPSPALTLPGQDGISGASRTSVSR